MKYAVKYSRKALSDLDRIWEEVFAASQDYEITEKYIDSLLDKIEAKADYPQSGPPLYYEDRFTGYYFVVFKLYMAFYRLDNSTLYVDRVLFGKSDYMRVIFDDRDQKV